MELKEDLYFMLGKDTKSTESFKTKRKKKTAYSK